jgi:hypothetical protein
MRTPSSCPVDECKLLRDNDDDAFSTKGWGRHHLGGTGGFARILTGREVDFTGLDPHGFSSHCIACQCSPCCGAQISRLRVAIAAVHWCSNRYGNPVLLEIFATAVES